MKLARVAKALGINERTLKLWIENPALAPYFTAQARIDNPSREMSEDDLLIANTIRTLRNGMSNHNVDWPGIAAGLESGYRNRDLPVDAITVDTRMSVMAQQQRTMELTIERDTAMNRVKELEDALRDERQARVTDNERLLRELADARVAAANVELDLYRSGRLKPE